MHWPVSGLRFFVAACKAAVNAEAACWMQMVFAHGQDITRGDYDESGPGVIHKRAA